MIKLNKLIKKYNHKIILNDVNLTINDGDLVLLLGENGSGKSTLLKIIGNVIYPEKSEMLRSYEILSYLPEKFTLPKNLSVRYYINFLEELYYVSLKDYVNYLEIPNKKIRELSKGNLQKLGLLYIIASNNDLILLDEPTEGMDKELKKKFIQVINKLHKDNRTIIVSTHDRSDYTRMNPRIIEVVKGNVNEIIKDI